MLILSARPIEFKLAPSEYILIRKLPGVLPLRLGMFSKPEICQLACKQLDVDSIPPEIEELLKEKSQGNPFYAGEIVNSLLESKQISLEKGKVVVKSELSNFEKIPETVQVHLC